MSKITRQSLLIALAAWLMGLQVAEPALAAPSNQPDRVEVGRQAPTFVLETLDGEPRSPEDLRGESPLLVIFFRGTW